MHASPTAGSGVSSAEKEKGDDKAEEWEATKGRGEEEEERAEASSWRLRLLLLLLASEEEPAEENAHFAAESNGKVAAALKALKGKAGGELAGAVGGKAFPKEKREPSVAVVVASKELLEDKPVNEKPGGAEELSTKRDGSDVDAEDEDEDVDDSASEEADTRVMVGENAKETGASADKTEKTAAEPASAGTAEGGGGRVGAGLGASVGETAEREEEDASGRGRGSSVTGCV